MNKHLLNAIMDTITFFSNCDDNECDPDTAVQMLETIACHIRLLSPKQKSSFIAHCKKFAKESDDPDTQELMEEIQENLGL